MDSKRGPGSNEIRECHNKDNTTDMDSMETSSSSQKRHFICLEGTHLTSTDTDQLSLNEELPLNNENSENIKHASDQAQSSKFCRNAGVDTAVQIQQPSAQKKDINYLYEGSNIAENNTEISKMPLKELIQELNENIQSIMDVIGTDVNDVNNVDLRKGNEGTFQEHKRIDQNKIVSMNHRNQLDKVSENKNDPGSINFDLVELERNVFDPGQEALTLECSQGIKKCNTCITERISQQSPQHCVVADRKFEAGTSKLSHDAEKIAEGLSIEGTRLIFSKQPRVSREVIIPMYDGMMSGSNVCLAPCEHEFHTLHIEADSSPTSSVMYRPPLCLRLWRVLADFITAMCVCLQVNRDCIFCLGFFVAFVVSASFLTAFFYRTLNTHPQGLQQNQDQQQLNPVGKPS